MAGGGLWHLSDTTFRPLFRLGAVCTRSLTPPFAFCSGLGLTSTKSVTPPFAFCSGLGVASTKSVTPLFAFCSGLGVASTKSLTLPAPPKIFSLAFWRWIGNASLKRSEDRYLLHSYFAGVRYERKNRVLGRISGRCVGQVAGTCC